MVMEASVPNMTSIVAAQPWTRVDIDLYEIAWDGAVTGYVEVVGSIFVALAGTRYDRAVEIGQALTFPDAVEALRPIARIAS